MKILMLAVSIIASIMLMLADTNKKEIIATTPLQVRWFTPSYYTDGRERAHLLGDSSQGGEWIDRVKMPAGERVLAHTHPQDELVTVIEGTWYLGEGAKFNSTNLKGYPAGSFIVIPACDSSCSFLFVSGCDRPLDLRMGVHLESRWTLPISSNAHCGRAVFVPTHFGVPREGESASR